MPRTAQANEKIRNQKKKLILRKSLILFAKNGYSAVSIDDIAKACNISHGLLYHYFKTKEDVFNYLINEMQVRIDNLISQYDEEKPVESLTNLMGTLLNLLSSTEEPNMPALIYIFLNMHADNEIENKRNQIFDFDRSNVNNFTMKIYRLIKSGQNKGLFVEGETRRLAYLLCSSILGLSLVAMKGHEYTENFPTVDMIMKIVIKE